MNASVELSIFTKHAHELSAEENAQLDELDHLAFSEDELDQEDDISWEPSILHFYGKIDGRIVSNVGVIRREIKVGDRMFVIGGIGGVATLPQFRRRGYARLLLEQADKYLKEQPEILFGMLFCAPGKVNYYAQSGYVEVRNPLYVHIKNERKLFKDVKMILQISHIPWPEGDVDVLGSPW